MPDLYRIPCDPHAEVAGLALDPDFMRRQRRVGVALAFASFTFFVTLFPLGTLIFVVAVHWFVPLWLSTAALQVLAALIGAHILFSARSGDRTRAQTLCGWLGGVAVVLAVLGVLTAGVGLLVGLVVTSLGPWCGVCGT